MPELLISGKLLTSNTADEINNILEDYANKLAEEAESIIHDGFNRNVQLSAMIGVMADQEAVRAILRSLKVEVISIDPIRLEAKFEDSLGHWYGSSKLPDDVSKLLQDIIDTSLNNWIRDKDHNKILIEVLNK